MAVTAAKFRGDFPEFANAADFPDSQINFWLTIAGKALNACIWGNMICLGIELYTAHNLVLSRQAAKAAKSGGTPGVMKGPVASEQVGQVSASYDNASGVLEGAGHWNLTTYGVRFRQLSDLMGAGPVQIGAPC